MLKWNAKTGAVSHVNRCRINALILTTVKINGWKGGPLCWKWDYADKTASEAQRWAEWKHWTHHTRSHTLSFSLTHTKTHAAPLHVFKNHVTWTEISQVKGNQAGICFNGNFQCDFPWFNRSQESNTFD